MCLVGWMGVEKEALDITLQSGETVVQGSRGRQKNSGVSLSVAAPLRRHPPMMVSERWRGDDAWGIFSMRVFLGGCVVVTSLCVANEGLAGRHTHTYGHNIHVSSISWPSGHYSQPEASTGKTRVKETKNDALFATTTEEGDPRLRNLKMHWRGEREFEWLVGSLLVSGCLFFARGFEYSKLEMMIMLL
jgi:hypothetical protein